MARGPTVGGGRKAGATRRIEGALAGLTPAALRKLRRHILAIARKAEKEAYRERMAALRAKKMALPPRRGRRTR